MTVDASPADEGQHPWKDGRTLPRVAWFGHGEGHRADGLSTYSRELVDGLQRRQVDVLFFGHDSDGWQTSANRSVWLGGRRIHALTVSRPGSLARVQRELVQFQPDVVHISWSFSQLDGAIARRAHRVGAGTVATFHLPYAPRGTARGRALELLYRLQMINLRHVDTCIALSDGQASLLRQAGYPASRIHVINNCVDDEAITPGASPLKAQFGATLLVGYMGRLDPEKRVLALAESFLRQRWPDDHVLAIAGSGCQEAQLRRLAAGRRNIKLLGKLLEPQDRLDLLRATDIFVLPSTAEGLALSMLEAMAAGCAVAATDAGEDGAALGAAGVLLPIHPLEPHLSNALTTLAADSALRAQLGSAARSRVEQQFGLRAHLDRVLGAYTAAGHAAARRSLAG